MLAILLTVPQNLNIKGRAKPLCPHPFRWTKKTRDVPNYFIWISLFPPDVPVPTFHCPLVIQFLVCQIPGECKPIVHYNSTLKVFLSMFQFFNLSQKVFLCQVFLLSCLNGKFFRYLISNLPGNEWTFLP